MADALELMKEACAYISGSDGTGTGYLVAQNRIATCHHVVKSWQEGATYTILLGPNAVRYEAHGLRSDAQLDCAILALDTPCQITPLPLATSLQRKAAWEGYGYPATATKANLAIPTGLPIAGVVSDPVTKDDAGRRALLLYSDQVAAGQASPLHGFSGSPVLVEGAVVGHLTKYIGDPNDRSRAAYGYVYACPIEAVRALLDVQPQAVVIAPPVLTSLSQLIPRLPATDYHVFVSYRSTDRPWAMSLVARLEGAGYRVFIDQKELLPGAHLADQLQSALTRSHAAVVLVSRGWLDSPWCQEEANVLLKRATEDKTFRLIPLRLDSSPMPALLDSRLWLDFQQMPQAEGPKVDELLYALIGQKPPVQDSPSAKVEATETRITEAFIKEFLEKIHAAAHTDPGRIMKVFHEWCQSGLSDTAPVIIAAEKLIGQNRPELALEALKRSTEGLRVRQLRALALAKSGQRDEAIERLERLRQQGELDAETGGLLAGRYKERWLLTHDVAAREASYRLYRETYEQTGDPFNGINAAAMALQCGDRAVAYRIADHVREALQKRAEQEFDHWDLATVGEALLLSEKFDEARERYRQAVARGIGLHQDIAVMRRQARLNLEALGHPCNRFDEVLPVPRVMAFMGHMVDAADRSVPRFPAAKIPPVREAIRQRLRLLGATHGVSTAARGSDILFIEELLQQGGYPLVVLPFPDEEFLKISGGGRWDERFRQLRDRVELRVLRQTRPPDDELPAVFAATNREVQRQAVEYARRLDETPVVLAVWDKNPGDGPGGTADAVALWQEDGYEVDIIDITSL